MENNFNSLMYQDVCSVVNSNHTRFKENKLSKETSIKEDLKLLIGSISFGLLFYIIVTLLLILAH